MSYTLVIRTQAAKQIDDGFYWYEDKKIGLGDDFVNEIERCFSNIAKHPFLFGELLENSKFRKMVVERFPFSIVFKVKNKIVTVYTVVHHKRKKRV